MPYSKYLATLLTAIATFVCLGCANIGQSSAIKITEDTNSFQLNVPVSRLALEFPKRALKIASTQRRGSTANPRYFYFQDPTTGLIVSGWFEPAERYRGIKAQWESTTKEWAKAGLPEPKAVSFVKEGDWEIVYYLTEGRGSQAGKVFPSVYAEYVRAGTWVELHLSVPFSKRAQEEMIDFIRSIQIVQKS
jgi:hypothetical protein